MPSVTENAPSAAVMQSVAEVVQAHMHLPGALLPILHGVQDAVGYVPAAAVPVIAQALNLSRAEVHGVVSYYHHFRSAPAGRHVVQICRAEACQAMGSQALWARACTHLGTDGPGTSPDGAVTLESVYCLGLCASSPAITVNGQLHARVGVDRLDRLLATAGEAPCV